MALFKSKKIITPSHLGNQLKQARYKTGLSLKIISKHLNINVTYLEALENNDWSKMPGQIYGQNFLKKYSHYLQVKTKTTAAAPNDSSVFNFDLFKTRAPKKFLVNIPKLIKLILITLFILVLVIYIIWQINLITTPPTITIFYPPDNLVIHKNFLIISGATDQEIKIKINKEDIFLQKDNYFQQQINLMPGINNILIEGTKKYARPTIIERKIIFEPAP